MYENVDDSGNSMDFEHDTSNNQNQELTTPVEEFYQSEETREVLVKAKILKEKSKKLYILFLGLNIASVLVAFILSKFIGSFFALLFALAGATAAYYLFKGYKEYFKFYRTKVVPHIANYVPMSIMKYTEKEQQGRGNYNRGNNYDEVGTLYAYTPIEKMKKSDNIRISNVVEFELPDTEDRVSGSFGKVKAYDKIKTTNSSGKTITKTEKEMEGIFFNIQKKFNLSSQIIITYEASMGSRLIESTMKSMWNDKKEFDFTDSLLEENFDCHIAPYETMLSTIAGKAINKAFDMLMNKDNDNDVGFNNLWDNRSIYEEELEKLHNIVDSDFESLLVFIYQNYGAFNLVINKNGIFFELLDMSLAKRNYDDLIDRLIKLIPFSSLLLKVMDIFKPKDIGRSAASHDDTYLDSSLFSDKDLKFFHINNMIELMRLPWLLYKYLYNADNQGMIKRGVSRQLESDFDYFENTVELKHSTVNEINKEYESYWQEILEEVGEKKQMA